MSAVIVMIIGRLGGDPETRFVQNGSELTQFSVAHSYNKMTEWYRCKAWGVKGKKIVDLLHKGDKIFVSGRLEHREYQKADGTQGLSYEVTVDSWEFAGGDPERKEEKQSGYQVSRTPVPESDEDDEIPF